MNKLQRHEANKAYMDAGPHYGETVTVCYADDVSALEAENERLLKPIDVLLFCPSCKGQHVDAPEPENDWTNPPHRKHLCHVCGNIWKAAEVPTNGVAILNRE